MNEHICMVCFMPSTRHDPRNRVTGDYQLPPFCCHGCGCGEEQPPDEADDE
jgi:hypothetical protein